LEPEVGYYEIKLTYTLLSLSSLLVASLRKLPALHISMGLKISKNPNN
jgi:hypothetical protein